MARRLLTILFAIAGIAACTAADEVVGPGQLVILDSSGDIAVIDPHGALVDTITNDSGDGAAYAQPIWSADASNIAWGQIDDEGFSVGVLNLGTGERTKVATPSLPFYTSWSPNGETLGVLHNGTSGVAFRMVDIPDGSSTLLDEAAPFYFSWNPAGDRVVTHAGADRMEEITSSDERRSLGTTDATYLAPQWTDAGVFHVAEQELVIDDNEGTRVAVASVPGVLTMFVANEQGTHVAMQTTDGRDDRGDRTVSLVEVLPESPNGQVVVVEVESGDVEVVDDQLAFGFFWSPDGQSLLVLAPSLDRAAISNRVWTVDGDENEYSTYFPPETMVRDMLPFFPQYAQSVRFWSPDSGSFAFAGDIDGEQGIWVQDVDEEEPVLVSDGIWVAWSQG